MPRMKFKFPVTTPRPARPSADQGETEESKRKDSFAGLCKDIRKGRHMTQAQVGGWFAVSAKTFARWEDKTAFPTKLQIPGVIAAIGTYAPDLVDRASLSLGVGLPARSATLEAPSPSPALAVSPTILKIALDGALFEAAERLGVPSARTREVAVLLFERAALLGLGVSEAAAMLRGPSPQETATRAATSSGS